MSAQQKPGLFGIHHSNRDFSRADAWGKNQFNSAFPLALANFLHHKALDVVHIYLNESLLVSHGKLPVKNLYGIMPGCEDLFFSFESRYAPYQQLVLGNLPRVDMVTQSRSTGHCLRPVEIKLTALPDQTTCELDDAGYACELVIRPDTIVYLACSILENFRNRRQALQDLLGHAGTAVKDWTNAESVLPHINHMMRAIDSVVAALVGVQQPFVMQPVWKTRGKSPVLAENCLDVFAWSNLAFTRLFMDTARAELEATPKKITRPTRTTVWLFRMLQDFSQKGQMDFRQIIDELSYNTKNDKAFSIVGKTMHKYMACRELERPRIRREEIRHIILGGGQHLLSPERRFDAILYNSQEIFLPA